jgi:hypothetical protein
MKSNVELQTLGGLLLRGAIISIGGALTSGGFTDTQVDTLSGAGLIAVGLLMSYFQKRRAAKLLKQAEAAPAIPN